MLYARLLVTCTIFLSHTLTAMEKIQQKSVEKDTKYEIGISKKDIQGVKKWGGMRVGFFLNCCPAFKEQLAVSPAAANSWAESRLQEFCKQNLESFFIDHAALQDFWGQLEKSALRDFVSCSDSSMWAKALPKKFTPAYQMFSLVPFFVHAAPNTKKMVWEQFIEKQETAALVFGHMRLLLVSWFCSPELFAQTYGSLKLHNNCLVPSDLEKFNAFLDHRAWEFFFCDTDGLKKMFKNGCNVDLFGTFIANCVSDAIACIKEKVGRKGLRASSDHIELPHILTDIQNAKMQQGQTDDLAMPWAVIMENQYLILHHFSTFYTSILLMLLMDSQTARVVEDQVNLFFAK